jgi:FMN phosphatase YigB (HAD superfamily)
MRPEVILLDCGGTLSWPPFARVHALIRELRGVDVPVACAYEGFYRSGHALEMYLRDNDGPPAADPIELQHWLYLRGFELTGYAGVWTRECTEELVRREGRMGSWDYTYPWVADALGRLSGRGYRLAVVSNSDGQVTSLLRRLGYASHFEVIIDSHVEGVAKPAAELFYTALERMGLADRAAQARAAATDGSRQRPPVLHVGDHYRADYLGASQAGLEARLIDPFGLYPELPADRRVVSIADLAIALCE